MYSFVVKSFIKIYVDYDVKIFIIICILKLLMRLTEMCKKLEELTNEWREAKSLEQEANRRRLAAEEKILKLCSDKIKNSGTTKLNTGIKVVRRTVQEWDQLELVSIYKQFNNKSLFPFKTEFKPVREKISIIQENNPDLWNMVQSALTTKEAKPAFSYGE